MNKRNTGDLHKYFNTEKQDRGIQKKLGVWDSFVQKRDTEMFSTSNNFLTSADVIAKALLDIISQHLQELAYDIDYISFLNMRNFEMKPYTNSFSWRNDCDNPLDSLQFYVTGP